jgi:flavorubredoxin
MKAQTITDGVWRLGVNITDPDYLFEGLWPIPDGVSINAYLVKGDKTALIDLTQELDDLPGLLASQIESAGVKVPDIDYIVVNHMEPDHSGWLRRFRELNTRGEILCTEKTVPLLKTFCGITDRVRVVKSGDSVDLGGGKSLVFYEAPNVHWPETMVTFEPSTGILFSCDAFGSYGRVDDKIFDDQLSEVQHAFYEKEALRYYANIVASFSVFVEKAIEKLSGLTIKTIAPSHGIIWREDPSVIIGRYKKYASYMKGPAEPEITLVWGSMYGFTKQLVDEVVRGIRSEKVPVHIWNVPKDKIGFILADAWKSRGLVLGMPTYEYKMFPPMAHLIDDLMRKRVHNKKVFRFGSFGWSGGAQKELEILTEKAGWEFLAPVEWQGCPGEAELKLAFERGAELARAVRE